MIKNAFYAQSGGVTSVINATACGVIQTAKQHPNKIGRVYAGKNGILGALHEELIDTYLEPEENIQALMHTPSGAFGSCRHKLKSLEENKKEYLRLIEVFKAHNIGYFFYNGGGDSQDTANKVASLSEEMGFPLQAIGIPKTIDNDLPFTDNCPGFGSVAKYIAVSIKEAGLDVKSMAKTSTKVFILEVMGRHTGWIAASSALAQQNPDEAPHIILLPEVIFDEEAFLNKVDICVKQHGFCAIVVSEGVKNKSGAFLSESGLTDAFGHAQLGGVAPFIASLIKNKLGYKYHWAVSDYLQRAARHIASQTDLDHAYALGAQAVTFAIEGKSAIMPVIVRDSTTPYTWHISEAKLEECANVEKTLPPEYISEDGFHITPKGIEYLRPLIQGEAYPPYKDGLPIYIELQNHLLEKKCAPFD